MHCKFKFSLMLLVTLGLFFSVGVPIWATDIGWETGADSNLSQSGDVRQPALAASHDGEIAAAWAGISETKKIFLAYGNPVTQTRLTLNGTSTIDDVWAPALAYTGTQLLAAWVEGDYSEPVGTLYQQDIGAGESPRALLADVYGYTAPRLQAVVNGQHLIIAAAKNSNDFSKCDLYHIYRPPGQATWLTPTQIITRSQVVSSGIGGIWYPDMALTPDGETMYLAWEQTIDNRRSVWFTAGSWQDETQQFDWEVPIRLSLEGIKAVRPKITCSTSGDVHVAWVEQVSWSDPEDPGKTATLQYINYRRLSANAEWTPTLDQQARRLDPDHVQVNTYRPTWSTISLVSNGNSICATWHGYRAEPLESGNEEIFMNCSHNRGLTWSDLIINVSETPEHLSLFPAMSFDGTALHIAWEEYQGGGDYRFNYDTFYRVGALPTTQKLIYLPLVLKG
ncbi:MAG: hypothetical protein U9Q70_04680 [Chloroflexota bacterium]|nr:hypothetical protein [Chloroflexota bacterium]